MRHLFVTLAVSLAVVTATAAVITPEEALLRLSANSAITPLSSGKVAGSPKLMSTLTAGSDPTVYVFSTGSGMMVLSADDEAEALLGYTDQPDTEVNPIMQSWLNEYSNEIEWLRTHPSVRVLSSAASSHEMTSIAPLMTTKWNQGEPYNNMCPTVDGYRCVTGCVATAMAQVVNYHRLPAAKGKGTLSYTWNGQTLSFDFANETFDWDNMLDSYGNNPTETQKNAVAKLMYACGVATQMGYGTGASGAWTGNAVQPLIDNFGFDRSVHLAYRQYYTRQEWDEYIYDQLSTCGPVLFSGFNDDAGHSFVCDGYQSSGYFHFNWGWGGTSDGYFRLSALDPSSQGIGGSSAGYTSGQFIIADVRAPRADSEPWSCMQVSDVLGIKQASVKLGDQATLTGGFYNTGSTVISGVMGLKITSVETGAVNYNACFSITLQPQYGYGEIPVVIPSNLSEGNYYIAPAWRGADGQWHDMLINIQGPRHINMRVSGSTAYFTIDNSVRLEMTGVALVTPMFTGYQSTLEGTLANISELEYSGNIFAALLTTDGTSVKSYGNNFMVVLDGGESTPVKYTAAFNPVEGETLTAGNYLLVFADEQGNVISDPLTVELKTPPAVEGNINVQSVTFIGNSGSADASDLNFDMVVSCTSGYFIGSVTLYIFDANSMTAVAGVAGDVLYMDEGTSKTVRYHGSVPSLTPGGRYFAVPFKASDLSQLSYNFCYFTVANQSAIDGVETDDANNVVGREIYTLSGVKVAEDAELQPGIYVIVEHMADGQTRKVKHIVR